MPKILSINKFTAFFKGEVIGCKLPDIYTTFKMERNSPRKTYQFLSTHKRNNFFFDRRLFVLGVLWPVFAFIIAQYLNIHIGLNDILVTVFIWFGVGFYPIYWINYKKQNISREDVRQKWITVGFSDFSFKLLWLIRPLIYFLLDTIIYFLTSVLTCLIIFVLHSLISLIYKYYLGISYLDSLQWVFQKISLPMVGILFIIVFILLISDVRFRYLYSLPKIYWGLKTKGRRIVYGIYIMLLMFILGGGSLGSFYNHFYAGIALSFITGLLASYSSTMSSRDEILDAYIELAKIRCLLRLNEYFKADFLLSNYENYIKTKNIPDDIIRFAKCIRGYQLGKKGEDIPWQLDYYARPSDVRYFTIFLFTRENIKHLLGFDCMSVQDVMSKKAHDFFLNKSKLKEISRDFFNGFNP